MLWWRALILTTFVRNLHTSASVRWPAGTYGIPKPASGCPWADGFQWKEGWRLQDTDDHVSNNAKSPEFHLDGKVGVQRIQRSFCIKTSTADDDNRPDWPSGQYCVYKKGQCPKGLKPGYVYWDDEDDGNANDKGGTLPDGCNETLTAVNGTFESPNYPGKYPDGQYCSWRITVNVTQQIHLIFSSFNLQNESNTDALYVYDGENATREVLGVFYGGNPPPKEGIYSSTNRMFVIFRSDKTDSYTGFSGSYFSVKQSAPSVTTTQTPDVTVSSLLTHATLHTLEKTSSTRELTSTMDGPSKKGGSKDERKETQGKGDAAK